MLYNPRDGELRVYKKGAKEPTKNLVDGSITLIEKEPSYIKILFYNGDLVAPMYGKGNLQFSCSITNSDYTDKLISFFDFSGLETRYYWIEYIWSAGKKFGKKYGVRIEKENIKLRETSTDLRFCFRGEVKDTPFRNNNIFITEFSKGKNLGD